MSKALSPTTQSALNTVLPDEEEPWHSPPSSPFVPHTDNDQENITPQHDNHLPVKLSARDESPSKTSKLASSPLKQQTLKSSPIKYDSTPVGSPSREDLDSATPLARHEDLIGESNVFDSEFIDDDFSLFSAVPNTDLTQFARLRSPDKQGFQNQTPNARHMSTPGTVRTVQDFSPSPTPKARKSPMFDASETTSLLLDFTQQMEAFTFASKKSISRNQTSPTKSATEPHLLSYLNGQRSPGKKAYEPPATPGRNSNLLNLLDFELPPPATPRSIPTITVREMESLKSTYLSQISSLTASLSGKEAEVDSLKKAVADAERRVGEAQEAVRDEHNAREHAERQKADWEKRGVEVEEVLKTIRKEIIASEKDREELASRLQGAERKAQEAESRAAESESHITELEGKLFDQALLATATANGEGGTSPSPQQLKEEMEKEMEKRFDRKVKEVSKELHRLYKEKHNKKMDAQKDIAAAELKQRESDWEGHFHALKDQINGLQAAKESTFSGVLPSDLIKATQEADQKRSEQQTAMIEEQKARLAGMNKELKMYQKQHQDMIQQLEQERIEKGELVAAAEQLMTLQMEMTSVGIAEDFKKSVSRPSGLRGPGFSGLAKPTSASSKSRMMSNIERMGSSRAAE